MVASSPAMSLETIQAAFHDPLERFIRHRVPDKDTADDLLQEVYLKIHRHLDTLYHQERLQAWVYRIARNVIHDYYRSRKPLVELDETVLAPETPEMTDDIHESLLASIRAALDCLPDDYRQALILTEYDGLTQKDLADRMGLSLSGAKSRVQRARKMLRDALLDCCHFEFDRLGAVIDYQPHCHCCAEKGCD